MVVDIDGNGFSWVLFEGECEGEFTEDDDGLRDEFLLDLFSGACVSNAFNLFFGKKILSIFFWSALKI